MSDFPKAVARVSEGFCPIHGTALRRVSDEWLTKFLERNPTALAPVAGEVGQCGMCEGRVWWTNTIDNRAMLRSVPELDADERRFLYDRGDD